MHVVIVGGGFGGVKAALELSRRQVGKVTLISDFPYFLHHATLYATATGKNDAESVIPLATIFADHPNVEIIQDKIHYLDADRKIIKGKVKDYRYDKLILALGSVTSFFNLPGVAKHAFSITTLKAINRFQDHIHDEVVANKLDKEYFVVGAGATGVEFAAALNHYLKSLIHTYRLSNRGSKVTLVEAAPRILPTLSATADKKVQRELKKQGVKVLTGHKVQALDDDSILINGKDLPTTTAVWTSGVAPNPFFARNEEHFHFADDGRVRVNPFLEALEHVYVIGDSSAIEPHHMALPAMRQAKHVAKNIVRLATNRPQKGYRHRSVPVGIPVGDHWGYVEWLGMYVAGRTGMVIRRWMELYGYTHLMPLKKAVPIWRAHDIYEVDV